jgi:hypothetical protein
MEEVAHFKWVDAYRSPSFLHVNFRFRSQYVGV